MVVKKLGVQVPMKNLCSMRAIVKLTVQVYLTKKNALHWRYLSLTGKVVG